jgi:hypothetical protein
MRKEPIPVLFAAIVLAAVTLPALAHHSVSAEFNGTQRIQLSGTVTKVAWLNPHTFFYVDAKDPKTGTTVNWSCELGSPQMLGTLGWTRSTLRVGMMVNFTGILARDGSRKVIARNIVADGREADSLAQRTF